LAVAFGFSLHAARRGQDAKAIKKKAGYRGRRWVVERSHRSMNRFRRILVRSEKREDTFFAMLHLACGAESSPVGLRALLG
jgi:putative transposase